MSVATVRDDAKVCARLASETGLVRTGVAHRLRITIRLVKENIFLQFEFFVLVAFSLVVPGGIFWYMVVRRAISRRAVFILGLVLLAVAGIDLAMLNILASKAIAAAATIDDRMFASEVSIGLYLLPALFAGIGINMVSHVLIYHLTAAEQRFDENHPRR